MFYNKTKYNKHLSVNFKQNIFFSLWQATENGEWLSISSEKFHSVILVLCSIYKNLIWC